MLVFYLFFADLAQVELLALGAHEPVADYGLNLAVFAENAFVALLAELRLRH